ncbi:MAG: 3-phosphoshikimate 1-carboxyvinyltransferase [Oscillospiraceae bacterium]
MDLLLQPSQLSGVVNIPASKSMAHRAIICAALCKGIPYVDNVTFSKDIDATLSAVKAFGVDYQIIENQIAFSGMRPVKECVVDCCESGSTLRFLIPVAAALGIKTTFIGQGRLPERPITPYIRELSQKGIHFDYNNTMPFTIEGKLQSGTYHLEGDISSQFVTGLLLALPLLEGDSEIILTSPLQSKPYADMTIDVMKKYGVFVDETEKGYYIKGNQEYQAAYNLQDVSIEGDFSQAAFFYVANAIGNNVTLQNIPENSVQGDRKIVEILRDMWYTEKEEIFTIHAEDIPDLVPILAVSANFAPCTTKIVGAERLRIKESDRLVTTADMLNQLGGNVQVNPDGLTIQPTGTLHGGTVNSAGDHRIAMCTAIAATRSKKPITLLGAECVTKSYPAFWEDYQKLGGIANGIHLE